MDGQARIRIWTCVLLLGAFAPMITAACLTERIPKARAVEGTVERPALAFMQHALNMGHVNPVGTIPGYFDFWNQGEHALEILELDPSCGCLGPKLSSQQRIFEPGERGRLFVSVATANETSGAKNYFVDVKYKELEGSGKNSEQFSEQVAFQLTIPERKVTVSPAEVYFYQLTGQADHRVITVADHRGGNLEVLDASITSDHATITLGEPVKTERGVWKTPIRIDVEGDVPPGRKIAVATIQTSDPEYGRIRVPVLIEGQPETVQLTNGVDSGDSFVQTAEAMEKRKSDLEGTQ